MPTLSSVSGVPAREKSKSTSSRPLRSSSRRARLSGLMSRCQTSAAVEELHRLEQVLAQPLELVDGQRAVLTDLVGQGVVADVLDADHRALCVRRASLEWRVDQPGDVGVGELAELCASRSRRAAAESLSATLKTRWLLAPLDQQRA